MSKIFQFACFERTRFLVFIFVLACAGGLFAQQPWEGAAFSAEPKLLLQAASAIPKERNADAVVLLDALHISVDESGRATQTYRLVYRVDTPNGVDHWAAVSYRYSPWFQARPVIKVRVITTDGVSHELDSKTLTDVAVQDQSENVYTDDHEYEGPLPAVAVGSVVEEETVIEDTTPYFEGSWSTRVYIGRSVPALHNLVTVETPSSQPLRYVTRLLPEMKVTKTEANGRTTTVFDQGRIEWGEQQPLLPPDAPRWPNVAMTTATSWHDVATRYLKRTEPRIRPAEVKSLVANMTGSQDEVLAAVLAKMHANTRYTGVEFGEAAIIPQAPSEVLKRKYGDCKDKAALLVSMLRAVGIPADLVLLNAGDGQDVDDELPGMTWFDHAIVYLPTKNLFIDATAEYSRFTELPNGDQGRLALVIAEDTNELKRTPDLPSTANGTVEKREMYLSEFGPARVVEYSEWFGPAEASLRSTFDGSESKQERQRLESYVKNMYLADALTKYEHSDPVDLKKSFNMRLEVAKARRGSTQLENAVAAIRVEDLVSQRLPDEILDEEKKESDNTPAEQKRKPRTNDWYLSSASVAEWQYKIVPPPGFSVRGLPESNKTQLGPAVLSEEYKNAADGVVLAKVRFDTTKRRYSVAEVTELRSAWKQFQNHGATLIYFDLNGSKLVQQGKVKEGLADLRKLSAMHPKEGLHRAQLARAFLAAGLGDLARQQAQEAVKLDPKSEVAQATLGFVSLHDVFGREFKKGWDRPTTIEAYRKAKELEPKNTDYRINLALALEYDAKGERYANDTNLKEAIAEYRELRKVDGADLNDINDRLVYAMAYAGQFKELRAELRDLGTKPLYNAMRVLCAAALDGPEAGVKLAAQLSNGEQGRSNALATAGTVAMRARMYPEATALLSAGAAGQENAGAMTNLANILKQTQKFEDIKFDEKDPAGFVFHVSQVARDAHDEWQKVLPYMSRTGREVPGKWLENYVKQHWFMTTNADLPEKVIYDLGVSIVKRSVEGDDAGGYRVSLQVPGVKTEHVYVVKEDGAFKILGENAELVALGQEALNRIARNDLNGAKVLLDWARDELKLPGGEDPYAGRPFPHLWNKGQEADAGRMLAAATMLLFGVRDTMKPYINQLIAERDKATNASDKQKLNLALMYAYFNFHDWAAAEEAGRKVLAEAPSPTVLESVAMAMRQQKKWSAIDGLVEELRPKMSDEMAAPRETAKAREEQGDFAGALKTLKPFVENGKATTADINNYGWLAVMAGEVPPDVLQAVQQTVQQPKNQNYAILHTLACMYAVAGQVKQAQQTLLDTLKFDNSIEPADSIWYGYARLAENYGEYEAAAKLYRKVEKPEFFDGELNATYSLAQNRLMLVTEKQGTAAAQ
jgi:transglutaminase-like putative cysteine protease/tetratricopeptide (TPR) repeat protein